MTKFTLDNLDYAILTHLQKDGRKAFTEIAKDLGVTDGTIRTRVARMVDSGTLSIIGTLN
jgi:Lrp/AsnC family transcriptional regulator for asnA, asnC and gidA